MVVLSDLLGLASIGCWLGAQFPQVIENIRRQSCDGIALPFLANWLLGDISNLIGCLLTHQLPFQTWLATYFVIVDCILVVQYFYYAKPQAKPSYHHPSLSATLPSSRRLSGERRNPSRYRTLSHVAANVAAAAAFAAQKEEEQQPPWSSRSLRPYPTYGADDTHQGLSSPLGEQEDDDALGESFYSEGGRGLGKKRLAWSVERSVGGRAGSVGRYPPAPLRSATFRNLSPEISSREPAPIQTTELEDDEDEGPSNARRSSRASRRGASMVFLSTWVLFGIGTIANRGIVPSSPSANVGRLLYPQELPVPVIPRSAATPAIDFSASPVFKGSYSDNDASEFPSVRLSSHSSDEPDDEDPSTPHIPRPEEPNLERVLGRIFAWMCTMLYLTSRLPQIWKNYVRKSVEGLSMALFIFAFLGNTFYVASILLSPKTLLPPPEASEFIRESIPYLLGSAGTLCFDITIVTQSLIYRPKPKRQQNVPRTLAEEEEEAGLLSASLTDDLDTHPPLSSGEAAILNRGRAARTRSLG
ncbi:hypothetical protein D9611_004776 [Ephemerocybe angulata]|uniref:Uncharacterized protein n=1 Tax=Ephemerocybe angulata TaxID=980116 RepID=A0A8H5EX64_9AGAR|nr:hypothetical protein D9611_004776 [Tulosesus angulatus]